MRAIITHGLYIFHPFFYHFIVVKEGFFKKILPLCMVCIQERVMMAPVQYIIYKNQKLITTIIEFTPWLHAISDSDSLSVHIGNKDLQIKSCEHGPNQAVLLKPTIETYCIFGTLTTYCCLKGSKATRKKKCCVFFCNCAA